MTVHVAALSLRDFRSYAELDLALDPGVTVLVGANGQGKTNVVEAVQYLATLSSHRVATDAPLVRDGCTQAHLAARLVHGERSLLVEVDVVTGSANRARVNRAPVRTTREVLGLLRTVLFAPEDLAVVKGDPAERRQFLDQLLVSRRPRLAGVRADYDRVLKQRTALLRSAAQLRRAGTRDVSSAVATLEVWDAHLARAGAELVAARVALLDALMPRVAASYTALAPGSRPVGLRYRSSAGEAVADPAECERAILRRLAEVRADEIDRGQCLVGPHRDEVVISLGDLPARGYASQGESWSLALALRLASFDLLVQETDSAPVLLLDDVFAELDARRRSHLVERLQDADQVLVTAAVPDDVPASLSGARYTVAGGQVRGES